MANKTDDLILAIRNFGYSIKESVSIADEIIERINNKGEQNEIVRGNNGNGVSNVFSGEINNSEPSDSVVGFDRQEGVRQFVPEIVQGIDVTEGGNVRSEIENVFKKKSIYELAKEDPNIKLPKGRRVNHKSVVYDSSGNPMEVLTGFEVTGTDIIEDENGKTNRIIFKGKTFICSKCKREIYKAANHIYEPLSLEELSDNLEPVPPVTDRIIQTQTSINVIQGEGLYINCPSCHEPDSVCIYGKERS